MFSSFKDIKKPGFLSGNRVFYLEHPVHVVAVHPEQGLPPKLLVFPPSPRLTAAKREIALSVSELPQ